MFFLLSLGGQRAVSGARGRPLILSCSMVEGLSLSGRAEGPPAPLHVSSQLFEKLAHLKHNHYPHPRSAGEQTPPP